MKRSEASVILLSYLEKADVEVVDTLREYCHFYDMNEIVDILLKHGEAGN